MPREQNWISGWSSSGSHIESGASPPTPLYPVTGDTGCKQNNLHLFFALVKTNIFVCLSIHRFNHIVFLEQLNNLMWSIIISVSLGLDTDVNCSMYLKQRIISVWHVLWTQWCIKKQVCIALVALHVVWSMFWALGRNG